MRISDWSSDVCSSDLGQGGPVVSGLRQFLGSTLADRAVLDLLLKIVGQLFSEKLADLIRFRFECLQRTGRIDLDHRHHSEALGRFRRSEEHTSELQSLMRISYAVFCLKKKNKNNVTILIQLTTMSEPLIQSVENTRTQT